MLIIDIMHAYYLARIKYEVFLRSGLLADIYYEVFLRSGLLADI
jgi:hypothetical protein